MRISMPTTVYIICHKDGSKERRTKVLGKISHNEELLRVRAGLDRANKKAK
jgi:hypothetical protein